MQTGITENRPRTASRKVRRRQLIEATIDSIAENGLSGTTMASVTGLADLSMGIVSFHFQSKENLLKETLIFLAEEHRDSWIRSLEDTDMSSAASLRSVIESHFDPSICTPRRIAVWFAFFGEARYRATYREKIRQFDNERAEVTERFCREIIVEGGYQDLDALEVTKSLESFADGLWLNIMMYPEWLSPTDAKRQINAYLAAIFPNHFHKTPSGTCGRLK